MEHQLITMKIGVNDLQAATDFYVSVLDMQPGGHYDDYCEWALLSPSSPIRSLIIYDTVRGKLAHRPMGTSWLVFAVDDVRVVSDRFRAAGVKHVGEPIPAPEFGVTYVITEDPFGNIIELTEPLG